MGGFSSPHTFQYKINVSFVTFIFENLIIMSQRFIKSALLITSSLLAGSTFAQDKQGGNNHNTSIAAAVVSDGSFSLSLRKQQVSQQALEADLNRVLGLSSDYSFVKVKERMDKRGVNHASYQQYFKGIPVDGGIVLVHVKNGLVTSLNGTIATGADIAIKQVISEDIALASAKKELNVVTSLKSYSPELVIAPYNQNRNRAYTLAYKVRVDGKTSAGKVMMYHVYINAATGSILKKAPLIAEEDVTGTGQTLYSGEQTIVSDSYDGGYRLRDNGRKIETYDVSGVQPSFWDDGETAPFPDAPDVTNSSADWGERATLMSTSLTEASESLLADLGATSSSTGKFLTAMVSRNDELSLDDIELVSGIDIKYDIEGPEDLPAISQGLYIPANAPSYRGIFANLDIDLTWGSFEMIDTAYFDITDFSLGTHAWADDKGNAGDYTVSMEKNPALDAHWGMGKTHDYYLSIFDRNSYDGAGSVVRNYINGTALLYGTQSNAAALPDPYNAMVYGMGDGIANGPFVGLDVMGHEFTHMVTEHNGNGGLNYEGESGALNESFSDIFGTCIEFYTRGEGGNFNIGEGVTIVEPFMMRSMSNPKSVGDPDTYLGENWIPTTSSFDNGGVHINSSVPNKWFYLMCQGGEGVNDNDYAYNVTAIGMDKAEQIAYLTLTEYLSPTSKFIDAYNGSLEAAADLYGEDSPEYNTVEKAWRAVGVPENDPTSLNNNSVAAKSVRVFPNPSTGNITIDSRLDKNAEAGVYNIVGSHMMSLTVKPGENSIDLSSLSKGIYMIKFVAGKDLFVQKIILR